MQQDTKEFTCISCPMGCRLKVTQEGAEFVVTGNRCPRGKKYALSEMTAPERIVTTTVPVAGGIYPVVSVRTVKAIPKDKVFVVMQVLKGICLKAPVKVGDVVVENISATGVDVIATHEVGTN